MRGYKYKPAKGEYHPKNRDKYNGEYPCIYRSSWELDFMEFCDDSPHVLEWASEPTFGEKHRGIPYHDPLKNQQTVYIPDFLITIKTVSGRILTKLIEIKPLHEAEWAFCRNAQDEAIYQKNLAKWQAAEAWCARRPDVEFQVLTERELYPGIYEPPKRDNATVAKKKAKRK